MNKKLLTISVAVLFVLLAGTFSVYNKNKKTSQEGSSTSVSQEELNNKNVNPVKKDLGSANKKVHECFVAEYETLDTSSWETYRNEERGVEFQYPKDWVLKVVEGENLGVMQQDFYIGIKFEDIKERPYDMYITVWDKESGNPKEIISSIVGWDKTAEEIDTGNKKTKAFYSLRKSFAGLPSEVPADNECDEFSQLFRQYDLVREDEEDSTFVSLSFYEVNRDKLGKGEYSEVDNRKRVSQFETLRRTFNVF